VRECSRLLLGGKTLPRQGRTNKKAILVTLKIRPSRQVCRPSAEIADKLVGYLDKNFD
jgi:hypothetical protein